MQYSPEVHLSHGLQQLRADEPVRAAPEGQQVNEQLQAQLTEAAAAQSHDAVLEHKHTERRHLL